MYPLQMAHCRSGVAVVQSSPVARCVEEAFAGFHSCSSVPEFDVVKHNYLRVVVFPEYLCL